jgi:predicted ArsR family transcriptional regulator
MPNTMSDALNPKFRREVGDGFREKVLLLKPLKERFGEAVLGVVREAVARRTRELWAGLAAQEPDNRPETLVDLLWNRLCAPLGFQFSQERTSQGIQLHCTRCPIHELARELDALEWGYALHCAQDPHIIAGFNPAIGFRQTRWLMRGDDCCDHFYSAARAVRNR